MLMRIILSTEASDGIAIGRTRSITDHEPDGFRMSESENRLSMIRKWSADHKLQALYLQRASSFAWATCGAASYVNMASTNGSSALLITQDGGFLFTDNIEAPRLEKEEKLMNQGWRFQIAPWYETWQAVTDLTRGLAVGSDGFFPGARDLSMEIARLRAELSPEEGQRFRDLGVRCAQAMEAAARAVSPGQSEYEIAGLLAGETESRGVQVTVNLIATDQRIFDFRHPLPTAKKLDRYAMLILCGRRQGLVCSVTRLVHFGRLPDPIRSNAEAVARVDATMIATTRPSRSVGDVFQRAIRAYAECGYPQEWQRHHQGGPAGFEPREFLATPDSRERVSVGQAYAWNPSITGTKSEDTFLVGDRENEVLTGMRDWPTIRVEVDGQTFQRPAILEVL
jgi:antitoxin VapB